MNLNVRIQKFKLTIQSKYPT